jgi:hypothetical protein
MVAHKYIMPCTASGRELFLWFPNITMPVDKVWIFLGDFNLIRARDIEINQEVTYRTRCTSTMHFVKLAYKRSPKRVDVHVVKHATSSTSRKNGLVFCFPNMVNSILENNNSNPS